jgi:YesN/AraC family two-component response regulator
MDMSASRKDTNELNKEIMKEIDDNYMKADMSLAYLTDKFGVSNKYITMLCKSTKGMTYIQYIQELRIKKATEYIKDGQHSLEEIAALCGYSNMLTFRRNFKSVMGVNPSEYN